jgi:hypothetical protein
MGFFPAEVEDNQNIPPIFITSFKKLNKTFELEKPIAEIKEIELSYKDNYFSFEFVALNYINTEKNQYAYMLEGFKNNWIYSGSGRGLLRLHGL